MKFKYILIIIPFLGFACDTSTVEPRNIYPTFCLVTNIEVDDLPFKEYTYNSDHQVTEVLIPETETTAAIYEYRTYDNNGQISKREYNYRWGTPIFNSTYEYPHSDTIIRKNYLPNETLERYDIYTLNPHSTCPITSQFTYDGATNELLYGYTSTPLDSNCSQLITDYNENMDIIKYTRKWVGNQKGIYEHTALPFLKIYEENQLIEVEVKRQDGSNIISESYTSTFEFDDFGYPISEERRYNNNSFKIFKTEYYCKY